MTLLLLALAPAQAEEPPTAEKITEIRDRFRGFPCQDVTKEMLSKAKHKNYADAFALLTDKTQKKINFSRFCSRMERFEYPEGSYSVNPHKVDDETFRVECYLMTSVSGKKKTVGSKEPVYEMIMKKVDECWLVDKVISKKVKIP
ncbi:MAG: hypothetical protein AB7S38_39380 [Vulcanimicrobiota bacterium]